MSDISITSANLIDKISLKNQGSLNVVTAVSSSDYSNTSFAHGLGYIPNCIAIYSDDPTFNEYYVAGLPPYFFAPGPALFLPRIDVVVESDDTNVYVAVQNLDTTRDVYYKIVGVIPSDITDADPLDSSDRDDQLLTSDDNFCKIVEDTPVTLTMATFDLQVATIPHNLGYRPMAIVHIVNGGRSRRSGQEASFYTTLGYTSRSWVDENNLYVEINTTSSSGDFKIYGRVYLDD